MKRDLDLCRELMLAFEALPPGPTASVSIQTKEPRPVLMQHISLLIDAGMLEGECTVDPQSYYGGHFFIRGITWAGHDFLDSAKSDGAWNAAKERIKQAGAWTFGLLLELLKEEAKKRLLPLLP